ncbi:MAG: 23S rRNA (pseudouridine(1915)-N(3))-methyltransferase RlmH [Bacillota bacterium]|nr:23S rRNA (pseudouridine(1915)-N(3))-methyltransferase RlmH [Bacillota bacterium]
MNIQILCVGKLKERHWTEAAAEYRKRLGSYCSLSIEEVKEEKAPPELSPAEEKKVREKEGRELLRRIREQSYVITLEIGGRSLSSEALAEKLGDLGVQGKSDVVFVIGGSLGLSRAVSQRADLRLSFSAFTFPHQLMRVILLEQLYRSFKILRGETYHK